MPDLRYLSVFLFITLFLVVQGKGPEVDPSGYVTYCPCMGRFGSQVEQLLGALKYSKDLNRTLILPAFNDYKNTSRAQQIPFDQYFQVDAIQKYHKVITMEDFMNFLAPKIWPPSKRHVWCFMERYFSMEDIRNSCNAKRGNPYGPYWDHYKINFVDSIIHFPLSISEYAEWNLRYPVEMYPVYLFTGPPTTSPLHEEEGQLQAFLKWSNPMRSRVEKFIKTKLNNAKYLGIHLRMQPDWDIVCDGHYGYKTHFFSTQQCLGYNFEEGSEITQEMCQPTEETIFESIDEYLDNYKIDAIYIATDLQNPLTKKIMKVYKNKYKVLTGEKDDPQPDLAILCNADYFIGNCVSSFSAFVSRDRKIKGKKVAHWGKLKFLML